jgi:hypothetical protein
MIGAKSASVDVHFFCRSDVAFRTSIAQQDRSTLIAVVRVAERISRDSGLKTIFDPNGLRTVRKYAAIYSEVLHTFW